MAQQTCDDCGSPVTAKDTECPDCGADLTIIMDSEDEEEDSQEGWDG